MKNFSAAERKVTFFAALALLIGAIISIFYRQINFFIPQNAVGLHTILEFASVCISFSIFTYGLRAFIYSQSKQLVYLSVLFFVIGSIDLLHALSFRGMPFLFGESSSNKAVWYWFIARFTGGIFLITTILAKDDKITKRNRNWLLAAGILYVAVIAIVVTYLNKYLPTLVLDNGGTTTLHKQLEMILMGIQLIVIITGFIQYMSKKKEIYLYVSLAIFYLMFSEYMLGVYKNLMDAYFWAGHLYKVIGYTLILRGIYFYFIDEVMKRDQALVKARQELDQVISEQHGLIFKIIKQDQDFIHTLCNGDLLYHLNLSQEELKNKSMFSLFSEKADVFRHYYNLVWETEQKMTFEIDIKSLSLYVTLKPIFINGKVCEIIGTAADLTRLKQMEAQIRENEKLGVLGELAAGIAHEVRNPLTTLKGFLQLIKAESKLVDPAFIELMLTEVDRIEMITDEFMSVARPHAHLFKREDMVEILQYVVKFMQPQALLKGVELHFHPGRVALMLDCEKNQLKQVFLNLIKNAIEAMPKGGNIYIDITRNHSNMIEIKIRDEGIGISEDVIEKLGQPFFTLKEGGNGLGLMMCRKIIDAHKGYLEISSKIGKGTTFKICLPLEAETILSVAEETKGYSLTGGAV